MSLQLSLLESFHAVAETGSLTRAAERLYVTQPAVTRSIGRLERGLRIRLFERRPRGVELTRSGRVLFERTTKIFDLVREAEECVTDIDSLNRGTLRIGATPTMATTLVPAVLLRFRRRFAQIRVTFEVERAQGLFDRLKSSDLDVGFTDATTTDPMLQLASFGSDRLVGVTHLRASAGSRKSVGVVEFCRQGLIVRRGERGSVGHIHRQLQEHGVHVEPTLALESSAAIKRAVAAGMGVTIMGRMSVDLEVRARELRVVELSGFAAARPMYEVRRADAFETKPIRAFVCILDNEWRAVQKRLAPVTTAGSNKRSKASRAGRARNAKRTPA
ncbi:MAG TPA: LysR family transcriptional regulator [Tepidisphaeraceae bacterium]|jgi:DNA-binding transcriptional LysR family regulator|nr:LysR family transcriptional regulator [Tepidisphaeraceae bacterium]